MHSSFCFYIFSLSCPLPLPSLYRVSLDHLVPPEPKDPLETRETLVTLDFPDNRDNEDRREREVK